MSQGSAPSARRVTSAARASRRVRLGRALVHGLLAGGASAGSALAGAVPTASAAQPEPPDDAVAEAEASAFTPVEPCRLLDTREAAGEPVAADGTVEVPAADRCEVAPDAVAVAVTLTAVRPAGPGYLTAHPSDGERPTASHLNYRADQVVANGALVKLGDGGAFDVYSLAESHIVVDVTGFFLAAAGEAAGRYRPVEATRLVDTRDSDRPAAGSSVVVDATDGGVPGDAVAVAVNVTTAATLGGDAFTAYAAGGRRPTASILNVDDARQARSASAIVPLAEGELEIATLSGNHVIVDVVGYFTGAGAEVSSEGLFVATEPTRLVDTRLPAGAAGGPRLWDGGSREFDVAAYTGGPVAAVAVNATMTRTEDAGYVALHPAGSELPPTSNVNTPRAQNTVANLAIVTVSTEGITASSRDATHLVLDATGWFTGEPVAAGDAAAVNEPPGDRRVVIIADSTMAGMRWNGTLSGLQGMDAVTRLDSCRRLVLPSCRGREGYAPRTVVDELYALGPVGPEAILVIGAGYDDWHAGFSRDVDIVTDTARSLGYHHIVWTTYLSDVGYRLPGGGQSNYGAMNTILRQKIATGNYPDVRLWDFDNYSETSVGWFYADGIHETRLGSFGVADWISRHVAAFDDKPCPQPWSAGEPAADPCPDPDLEVIERGGVPDIASIYDV